MRHCQTDWNRNRRIQGTSDVPLNDEGRRQSSALAEWFKQFKIDAIYSSPMRRAIETAEGIAKNFNLEIRTLEGLRELNHGILEGESSIDVWNRHGALDPMSIRLPGGESIADLKERVLKAVNEIIHKHPDENVILVGHHFTNLIIIAMAIGLDLRNIWRLKQDESAVSLLLYNEFGWRLIYCNSLEHLHRMI